MAIKKWFAGLTLALLGSVVLAQGTDNDLFVRTEDSCISNYSLIAQHLDQTGGIFTFYQIIGFTPTGQNLPKILRSEAINYAEALSWQEAVSCCITEVSVPFCWPLLSIIPVTSQRFSAAALKAFRVDSTRQDRFLV